MSSQPIQRSVLDSSAVIALLHQERGADKVVLAGNLLSSINYAEVVAILDAEGQDTSTLLGELELLGLMIKPFTANEAQLAGELREVTKANGLSLGDRACLAVARLMGLEAVTADKAWQGARHGVKVMLIR